MVAATLKEISSWYEEPTPVPIHRPKLLSKLATLELCGWLEGEFDRIVMTVQHGRLNDPSWVTTEVLSRTNGFRYNEDLRAMLSRIVGEVFARRVEARFEAAHPGDLDQFKSTLGQLWKVRCSFAHADVSANIAAQQKFEAPSWTVNQHRILYKLIGRYEQAIVDTLQAV